jgi:monoamine oxidase
VLVAGDELTVSARNVVVSVPPALTLEIAFDPVLPADRAARYRNTIGGWGSQSACSSPRSRDRRRHCHTGCGSPSEHLIIAGRGSFTTAASEAT